MMNASIDATTNVGWDKQWDESDLVQICRSRAIREPNDIAYTYLVDGETEEANLTYDQLDRRARAIAAELQRVAAPGDRALLVFEPGLDYIAAFFGCLYADVIAVPVYPPNMLRLNRSLPRLMSIMTDSQATIVMCTSFGASWASLLTREASAPVSVISIDDLWNDDHNRWTEPTLSSHRLAYLQYTSGSTGEPKGVMVSHRNLLYNVSQMDRGRSIGATGVTWLPAYHDFGLIGAIILPMYSGCRTISMSPLAFVQRPLRWLEAISRYRGTITGAPNFSFDLCVKRSSAAERRRLDLSCLTVILNGAEPVRHNTMRQFLEAFSPCGLPSDAFVPCYGLAEATLGVASAESSASLVVREFDATALERDHVRPSEQEVTRTLVSNGTPFPMTELAIVCPQSRQELSSDRVGEIWVRGPGVAMGYWNQPETTAAIFNASLSPSADQAGNWLRTGDLGFLAEGQLFITGRWKDMIIVHGRNIYPQDIEQTVQLAHPANKPNAGATFSMDRDGQERLIIVQEILRPHKVDLQEVAAAIRESVLLSHDLVLDHLVLIQAGTIPKTTSGKIQRSECRRAWLENRLSIVAQWHSSDGSLTRNECAESSPLRNDTERRVAELFCEVLCCKVPGRHESFFDLGGQSLLATQFVVRAREAFLIDLPLKTLFLTPTVAGLATEIDRQVEATKENSSSHRCPAITPIAAGSELSLSAGQERIWFVHHLTPNSPLFNLCLAVRIRRSIDSALFEQAWRELVEQHDSLRTVFPVDGQHPCPKVQPKVLTPIRIVDLCGWKESARDEELSRIGEEEAASSFDLAVGPLWRVTLVRCGESDQTLFLAMHHIITDGWSMNVLLRELLLNYAGLVEGQTALANGQKKRPAIQYGDYAAWHRGEAMRRIADRQVFYWQKQLATAPSILSLPTDRPRPASPTFRGATVNYVFTKDISRGVERLARCEGATPFMVIMAALQTVLSRYSGQEDICVGTAVAGRSRPELEGLIGFFVNTLVLRGDLAGDPTFRELLLQIRDTALMAYDHADVPFERLVEELAPQRDIRHAPLFQVSLVFQNQPWQESNADVQVSEVHNGTAKYDLTWTMWYKENQLQGSLEYSTELFEAASAQRLIGSLQTLLSDAIENPDSRIRALALMSTDQREEWLRQATGDRVPLRDKTCIHHLFEDQAAVRPFVLAIDGDGVSRTYNSLNQQANRLASRLRQLGVIPETLVGISLPRSDNMIAAVIATLKAGGACLPLDPDYPPARLAQMICDARPCVILTDNPARFQDILKTTEGLGNGEARWSGPEVVKLEIDNDAIATSDENLPPAALPTSLAYVIYTSGSTGVPKGVMVEHRSVCHMVTWYGQCLGVSSESRVLQFASLSFDAAMGEIFAALCQGATLVLPPQGRILPGQPVVDFLHRQRVTTALIPPSFLEMLPDAKLPYLQDLTVSGEVCPREIVRRFAPGRRMYNGYGPTEGTVGATWSLCNATSDGPPPIGRPFPNVRVYLLDSTLQPVPTGVIGEIFIAGPGVARGYLNRPELNKERFLPDPYQTDGRMYRTGDLARRRADGIIEYVGRCDDQVKIRGYRIEPGEIETALERIVSVRRAVVVARSGPSGQRLAAYYTLDRQVADAVKQPSDLRAELSRELPPYMLPTEFVEVETLPLLSNGKVDRAALSAVPSPSRNSQSETSGPRNDDEGRLVAVWCNVLGLKQVGIHENYFEVGGDSLRLMQIAAAAAAVGLRLTPRQLFEHQTIAEQAAAAERLGMSAELGEETGEIPLSPIQHWFLDGNPSDPDHFNQAVMLQLNERPNAAILKIAMEEVFAKHDALRLRCENVDGHWRQWYAEETIPVTMDVVDMEVSSSHDVAPCIERLAAAQQRRLNLANGPTMIVTLINTGNAGCDRLLFVAHHLFIDAVSWHILLDDLYRSYIARLQGRPVSWPPRSATFGEFVRRCKQLSSSEDLPWNAEGWQKRLSRPFAKLPRDGNQSVPIGKQTEPQNLVGDSRELTIALTAEETSCLIKGSTRTHRAQVQELLLSALAETLLAYSKGDAVRIDLERNGRDGPWDDLDLSRTVGWFTTIEPLVLERTNPDAMLASVQRELRESRQHHDFGIQVYLSEHSKLLQKILRNSSAQISFNFLGLLNSPSELPGLSIAPDSVGALRSSRQTRHYDIELNAMIQDGRLRVGWTFSPRLHRQETVDGLAQEFLSTLRRFLSLSEDESPALTTSVIRSDRGTTAFSPPRDALEHELVEIWESVIQSGQVGIDETFASLGGSQHALARILAETTRRFGVVVEPMPSPPALTITQYAALLRTAASRHPQTPLVPIESRGNQTPIFLVHPAGGNIFPYYNLAHRLGADQPVWGLEARGLEGVLSPHTSVGELADAYLNAIVDRSPSGPYRLGGWSFGGLVAYEMAYRLRLAGEKVEWLGLIDTRVVADANSSQSEAAFAGLLAMFPGADRHSAAEFMNLEPVVQLNHFIRHVETAGLTPAGLPRSTARRMLEVFEANSQAWLEYVPPSANGPVRLFLAEDASEGAILAKDLGWATPAGKYLTVTKTPGDHLTMMREPHALHLARQIIASIPL